MLQYPCNHFLVTSTPARFHQPSPGFHLRFHPIWSWIYLTSVVLEAALQSQDQHTAHDSGSPRPPSSIAASAAPVPAAPAPVTALSINPGVRRIKSWAARLLMQNTATAPMHEADTTQHEIVFDTITPLPLLPPTVPSQDDLAPPALHTACISLPMQPGNPRLSLMEGIGSNIQPDGFSPVSPSTAHTWNTGPCNGMNNNFNYTAKYKAAVEQECCSDTSPFPQSVSWSEFTINLQMFKSTLILVLSPLGVASTLMIV
jgi:hypothetical protein